MGNVLTLNQWVGLALGVGTATITWFQLLLLLHPQTQVKELDFLGWKSLLGLGFGLAMALLFSLRLIVLVAADSKTDAAHPPAQSSTGRSEEPSARVQF